MKNKQHLLQGLSLSFLLCTALLINAQEPPSARINVDGFVLEGETTLDSGYDPTNSNGNLEVVIEPDLIRYDLPAYILGAKVKLVMSAGNMNNHDLEIGIEMGNTTLSMQFFNGEVSANNAPLFESDGETRVTVALWDVFYFELQSDGIQFKKNQEVLHTQAFTGTFTAAPFVAYYEQSADQALYTTFEIEGAENELVGMQANLDGIVLSPTSDTETFTDAMEGVDGVSIVVKQLADGVAYPAVTTGGDGRFTLPNLYSGLIEMTPSFGTPVPVEGIDGEDLNRINDHLAYLENPTQGEPIKNPLFRLAADVDRDGQITDMDRGLIEAYINNDPTVTDNPIASDWWFVPIPYAYPTDYHPDIPFTTDFWEPRLQNNAGEFQPFGATLRYNAKIFTYQAGEISQSWMDKLHEWMFDANPACEEVKWGFYMIRPGDLDGSSLNHLGPTP